MLLLRDAAWNHLSYDVTAQPVSATTTGTTKPLALDTQPVIWSHLVKAAAEKHKRRELSGGLSFYQVWDSFVPTHRDA